MIDAVSPRALVLDMDGLMVDSEPLWFEVERAFVRSRGPFEWTGAQWHACIGRGTRATLETMRGAFGFDVDFQRDFDEIHDLFLARLEALRPKTGLFELLDAAAGRVPLAVASSAPRRLVSGVLNHLGVADRFRAVVTGDDVERPKPAPDIFLLAAERLGVPPAECLVLEDSLAGATAGRAAGMRVIAVPEKDAPAFAGVADFVVGDLDAARERIRFG